MIVVLSGSYVASWIGRPLDLGSSDLSDGEVG